MRLRSPGKSGRPAVVLLATLSLAIAAAFAVGDRTGAQEPPIRPVRPHIEAPPPGSPVDVVADRITYDSETEVVTATGNVRITYGPYTLNATEVVYDVRNDRFAANGDVVFREPTGNIITANRAEFSDRLREGFAEFVTALLVNRVTVTADYARRTEGRYTIYERVSYTACQECRLPDGRPMWQLHSSKTTHDQVERTMTHEDVWLEMFGLPVFYIPELTQPDPGVDRMSGFLVPAFVSSREFGFGVEIPYYWALAPNYDFTFSPVITTRQGPLLKGEWRHRLDSGAYHVNAAGIYQLDKDLPSPGDRRFRGFVRTAGAFRLNERWNWGWDYTAMSDETFMRRYRIDGRVDIVNQIYLEGLKERNYFAARTYNFKGLLSTDVSAEIPYLVPAAKHRYIIDRPVFGGEFGVDTDFYSLHREDPIFNPAAFPNAAHATRMVTRAHWRKQLVTDQGAIITPQAEMRGDVFHARDLPPTGVPAGPTSDETTARILPTAGLDIRWPFVRHDHGGQHVFEPVAQIFVSPNETRRSKISNEDSVTINVDHTNLFTQDRFTGVDRFEGGVRANVGFNYTFFTRNGNFAKFTLGQSYHLAGRNSFDPGSGLSGTTSDIIAGVTIQPMDNLRLSYFARLDDRTFDINAQGGGIWGRYDRLTGAINYVDLEAAPMYGRPGRTEQIWAQGSFKVQGPWRVFGELRYDIDRKQRVRNEFGVAFDCDCMNLALSYREDFTRDRDVRPDRSVRLSVELRTLGGANVSVSAD